MVSFLLGSKTVKENALSHQYLELSRENSVPTSVIPSDHILAAIRTNLTSPIGVQILAAQPDAPSEWRTGRCFVPVGLCIRMQRTSYHNFKTAGHPSKNLLSWGHMVILLVVKQIFKMCHCVPFKTLPITRELASVFARMVFCLHRLPEEIVSDCVTQLMSRFWRSFCSP